MPTLTIDISARLASFQDSLDKIGRQGEQMAGRLDKAFGSLRSTFLTLSGALAGFAALDKVRGVADLATELDRLRQSSGISIETLSALRLEAAKIGVSFESVSEAINKFGVRAAQGAAGNQEFLAAFKALGITQDDLKANLGNTEALLKRAANSFSLYADGANKSAIAAKLFEEGGTKLIPVFNQGAAGIERARSELQSFGGLIGGKLAEDSKTFNAEMAKLRAISEATSVAIGSALLPTLNTLLAEMLKGREIAGGFASALATFGTINPFRSLQGNIDATKRSIEDLQAARERYRKSNSDTRSIDQALETEAKRLEFLRFQQRNAIKGVGDPSTFDARDLRGRQAPQAPGLPDSGAASDAFAAFRARAENQAKVLGDAFKAEEQATKSAVEILSGYLDQNLISFRTFYDERERLQRAGLEATIRAAEAEIAAAKQIRAGAPKESDRLQQDQKIADAQARIEAARAAFAVNSVRQQQDATKAANDYRRALEDVGIQLAELRGDTEAAAARRFRLQSEELRNRLTANNDQGGLSALDELERRTSAQAAFNSLLEQSQRLQDQLANAEARINIDRQSGAAGELTVLQRLTSIRAGAIDQYRAISERLQEIATSVGDPRLAQQADNFKRTFDEFAASADAVGNKFRKIGQGAFADFFSDVLEGTKSIKEAFADMGRSILRAVNQLVAQDIAKKIFGAIGGGGSSGGGGKSGSGFLDFLGSIAGSIFGGARAEGGPVSPGRGYIVGERGPEWFVPRSAGTIVPNGAGGTTINYSPTFIVKGDMTPQSRSQLAAAAYRGLQEGRRNL